MRSYHAALLLYHASALQKSNDVPHPFGLPERQHLPIMRRKADCKPFYIEMREGCVSRLKRLAYSGPASGLQCYRITAPYLTFLTWLSDSRPESFYVDRISSKTAFPRKHLIVQRVPI